ncbi:hypothetical protein R1flu_012478 [Riccia fluitans]|uniref:Cytochrome P450 n=1 Tax=Riccia fluitans TaxID=41844 RepID=A0ABD1ZAV4_9MARC
MEWKRESDDRGAGALTMDNLSAMKYSWKVIQDALRLEPPAATAFYEATTNIEYNGYLIPKGWMLMWSNQHLHYDLRFFQDPITFHPSRKAAVSEDTIALERYDNFLTLIDCRNIVFMDVVSF